mmetsp:Transcript_67407/g.93233  ORF Transcript_67407/g.93233 Transcript_67407/m.93233 type:complete len:80 (+) Transcript_67407:303-542(+)
MCILAGIQEEWDGFFKALQSKGCLAIFKLGASKSPSACTPASIRKAGFFRRLDGIKWAPNFQQHLSPAFVRFRAGWICE